MTVADVVSSSVTNGEVRAKLGNATDGFGFFSDAPVYGADGFYSRPNDPSDNGDSAQAFYVREGDQSIVIGYRDNRYAEKVGELEPGDRAIVTDGDARVIIKRKLNAVFIISKNDTTGKTLIFEMSGSGVIQMFNDKSWITMTGDSIQLSAGNGSSSSMITLNANGIHFLGNSFNCGTMGGHFGYMIPPAPPAPGVAPTAPAFSVIVGPAGQAGVGSTKWTMTV